MKRAFQTAAIMLTKGTKLEAAALTTMRDVVHLASGVAWVARAEKEPEVIKPQSTGA
jgi:hypothetical protein